MRNYDFRRLASEDMPLMRRWLQSAHVRVWWPDPEKQETLMRQDLDNPRIDMFVVSLMDHPFAYIHDHDARVFDLPQYADLPAGARAMATFVGDSEFLGQGHATGYVDARVRDLRRHYPMVAVGPDTADTRSIGVFTAARFMKRRLASTRDGRLVQVMTHL